jgi:hypothetical protein
MILGSTDDTFRMGENFEILAARDGNERDATTLGEPYAGSRGRRDGRDDRRAEPCCFLHKLYGDAARQKNEAVRRRNRSP